MAGTEETGGTVWWAKYIPKQGTGIVGRLSTVAIVVFIAMGFGVYTLPGDYLKLFGVLAIAATFLVFLFMLVSYAEKNPLHASLEGGELVQAQLKQWEIAAKGGVPALPAANVAAPEGAEGKVEGGQK